MCVYLGLGFSIIENISNEFRINSAIPNIIGFKPKTLGVMLDHEKQSP